MVTCEERMKKGFLEKCWNCVSLEEEEEEEEEREGHKIRGLRKQQLL